MAFNIILSEEARRDEIESYQYYEAQRVGLGEEFLNELEHCYTILGEHPHLFSFIDTPHDLRDVKLKRFPFVIIYEISAENVYVYSVHHTSRLPKKR